jgi:hypothetical protein
VARRSVNATGLEPIDPFVLPPRIHFFARRQRQAELPGVLPVDADSEPPRAMRAPVDQDPVRVPPGSHSNKRKAFAAAALVMFGAGGLITLHYTLPSQATGSRASAKYCVDLAKVLIATADGQLQPQDGPGRLQALTPEADAAKGPFPADNAAIYRTLNTPGLASPVTKTLNHDCARVLKEPVVIERRGG